MSLEIEAELERFVTKRYLLIEVGYHKLAIPYESGAQLAAIVELLADARHVDSKGYGDKERLIPASDAPPQMSFVDASKVVINDELASLKARLDAAEEEAAQRTKWWTDANAKVQKLDAELKALKATPSPTNEAAPNPVPAPTQETSDDIAF